ncbi:MAG: hypothetical protein LPL29_14425 [Alphaproteobacteria bacterium]|nr:hypothetical protein [Alphaproteobacteria bacterium]
MTYRNAVNKVKVTHLLDLAIRHFLGDDVGSMEIRDVLIYSKDTGKEWIIFRADVLVAQAKTGTTDIVRVHFTSRHLDWKIAQITGDAKPTAAGPFDYDMTKAVYDKDFARKSDNDFANWRKKAINSYREPMLAADVKSLFGLGASAGAADPRTVELTMDELDTVAPAAAPEPAEAWSGGW